LIRILAKSPPSSSICRTMNSPTTTSGMRDGQWLNDGAAN
jgi:hypothetical protein